LHKTHHERSNDREEGIVNASSRCRMLKLKWQIAHLTRLLLKQLTQRDAIMKEAREIKEK
jgi:hypothetical protein